MENVLLYSKSALKIKYGKSKAMQKSIFHGNPLPAGDLSEISSLIFSEKMKKYS